MNARFAAEVGLAVPALQKVRLDHVGVTNVASRWNGVGTLSERRSEDVDRLSTSIRLNILHADIHIYSDLPDQGVSG